MESVLSPFDVSIIVSTNPAAGTVMGRCLLYEIIELEDFSDQVGGEGCDIFGGFR